jgi:predicted ester cyclase
MEDCNMTHQTISSERNKAAVTRLYEEFFNRGRKELLGELISTTYTNHTHGGQGRDAFERSADAIRSAVEGLHFNVEDTLAEADRVAIRLTVTGKQVGPFFGTPATGEKIERRILTIFRLEEGLITDSWLGVDPASARRALEARQNVA